MNFGILFGEEACIEVSQINDPVYAKKSYKIQKKQLPNSIKLYPLSCPLMPVIFIKKLDGVGPVDNRPSTDLLHHFV